MGEVSDPKDRVLRWLAGNDTGTSSKCVAFTYLGVPCSRPDWPSDPADLGRCLRLMRAVPEIREGFVERMAKLGPVWREMALVWPEIEASMLAEVGMDWEKGYNARKTYDLMKKVQGRGWTSDPDYDVVLTPDGHISCATLKPRQRPRRGTGGAR